ALTRADQALERADEKAPSFERARAALEHDRRWLGIRRPPPGQTVSVDRELAYAALHRRVSTLVDDGKLPEARAAIEAGRREFSDIPGIEVMSCEIDARQNRFRQAEKACAKALSLMPDLPRAHYLLGHIKLQAGARDVAIKSFRRSIE